MKKILLLGGDNFLIPIVKAAKKIGCYVITCDYLPDNVAHKYSDEYINVSTIDKEKLLKVSREKNIDGILTFTDSGVVSAAYVAEQMGLPSPGPYDSIKILQNKALFRKFLSDNGFNVPKARGYSCIEEALEEIQYFEFPIIIKPTDSAGSKGVTRVDEEANLREAIEHAIEHSFSNTFIIEEFLEKKGFSSDSDSFVVNGDFKFISFSSQRFNSNAANPYTPAAYSWPSSFSYDGSKAYNHEKTLSGELQRLITLLEMRSSIYNIETLVSKDNIPYIMEVSPRGGGNRLAEMLHYATGVDLITNAVRVAIGETVIDLEQKPYNGYWAEIIIHSEKGGIFKELLIDDKVIDKIVEKDLWIKKGDNVNSFTSAKYAIGTLVLKFETSDEMEEYLSTQREWLEVEVY